MIRAPIEPAWTAAPPPVAGAEVAELAGVVPEAPPPLAVVASVVLGDAGCVPEGWAAEPPDGAGALPAGALPAGALPAGALPAGALPAGADGVTSGGGGAFVTVGTEAGGVTWIWPSDC